MTQPDLANLYRLRANARLQSAGLLLRHNPSCQFAATPQADIARSNIGMTIWSAAIDLGSVLLIQERQETPTGRSPQISRFITREMHQQRPQLNLNIAWTILVRLHNIQHLAGHPPNQFGVAAAAARRSIAVLNHLMLPQNRVDPNSYNWLARVRDQHVNWFRDEPTALWPAIAPALLNAVIPNGGTVPLHWAAQNHDDNAVATLIAQGAHVDTKDSTSQQTPLHWAARSGTPQAIHTLVRHGANIEELANLGRPLHYAAAFNGYDTVEALINSQANVNSWDINEETPLHWAARWQQDVEVARLLIRAGSRQGDISLKGQSPYDLAVSRQSYFTEMFTI